MARKIKYKKYEPWIKAAISMTGRPDLFPDLNVPRTTAHEWIKRGYRTDDPIVEALTNAINITKQELQTTRTALMEKESLRYLVKDIFATFCFSLRWKHIESKEIKSKILDAIENSLVTASRDACLETIDLSLSRYKKWRRERRGCGIQELKTCPRSKGNQLTFQEVQTMKTLVTAKEYSHFPILSLHYYAKREKLLFCSYSTWRKYIDQYGWLRPRKKPRKKYTRIGIRAKHPNEIWHMDVSQFILPNNTKGYIQAIIDNYSRYVIAWKVMDSYDGSKSAALLQNAIDRTSKLSSRKLIVDGGGENCNQHVRKLENSGHFIKQVAKFEISFSNSIVETVFRSLKHNYLFHKEITSVPSLRRHVDFWCKEHNEVIPHTSFKGETPSERFNQSWSEKNEIRIFIGQKEAIKLRVVENQKIFCELCKTG